MQLTLGGRNALYRINPRTGDRKEIIGGRRRLGRIHLRHGADEGRVHRDEHGLADRALSSAI